MKIIGRKRMSIPRLAVLATGAAGAVLVATISPAPLAQAHPGYASTIGGAVPTATGSTPLATDAASTPPASDAASTPPATGTATAIVTATATVTAPGEPTNVQAIAGNGEVFLSWDAPEDDGGSQIVGYLIAANDGEAFWQTDGTETAGIIDGLTNGKSYTFVVMTLTEGIDASSEESVPSNAVTPTGASVSATTGPATRPVVAGNVTAVIPGGSPDTGAGGSAN